MMTMVMSRKLAAVGTNFVRRFSVAKPSILPFKELPHGGIEINLQGETIALQAHLEHTISHARSIGKTSIHLKVPIADSHHIPTASQLGFRFHHAEGDYSKLMLWLPSTDCKVPPFATLHCGVAGVLFHENSLLVVKEKAKQYKPHWKLPGGYVNLGEHFSAAAMREVFEETGIRSEFHSVLAFRHVLNQQFGRGDVYVICRLSALSREIQLDDELDDAMWMPIEEYKALNTHPMLNEVCEILLNKKVGFTEKEFPSWVQGKPPFKMYVPSSSKSV